MIDHPRLARAVRLRRDAARDRWVLLGPELLVTPDPCALAVLRLLDGRSMSAIVDALLADYEGSRDEIASDVRAMLAELEARGLLVEGAPP